MHRDQSGVQLADELQLGAEPLRGQPASSSVGIFKDLAGHVEGRPGRVAPALHQRVRPLCGAVPVRDLARAAERAAAGDGANDVGADPDGYFLACCGYGCSEPGGVQGGCATAARCGRWTQTPMNASGRLTCGLRRGIRLRSAGCTPGRPGGARRGPRIPREAGETLLCRSARLAGSQPGLATARQGCR